MAQVQASSAPIAGDEFRHIQTYGGNLLSELSYPLPVHSISSAHRENAGVSPLNSDSKSASFFGPSQDIVSPLDIPALGCDRY